MCVISNIRGQVKNTFDHVFSYKDKYPHTEDTYPYKCPHHSFHFFVVILLLATDLETRNKCRTRLIYFMNETIVLLRTSRCDIIIVKLGSRLKFCVLLCIISVTLEIMQELDLCAVVYVDLLIVMVAISSRYKNVSFC